MTSADTIFQAEPPSNGMVKPARGSRAAAGTPSWLEAGAKLSTVHPFVTIEGAKRPHSAMSKFKEWALRALSFGPSTTLALTALIVFVMVGMTMNLMR